MLYCINNYEELVKQSDLKAYEQKVIAKMVIIKKDEFAKRLVALHMSDYNGVDGVKINNINDLKINIAPEFDKTVATSSVSVAVEYKGSIKWNIDVENIKKELVGKGITNFATILGKYAGVDTAKPSLSPMWSHTFPNSISKIKVELE